MKNFVTFAVEGQGRGVVLKMTFGKDLTLNNVLYLYFRYIRSYGLCYIGCLVVLEGCSDANWICDMKN